jgi:uncharacterized delta-60 repeat protein
MFFAPFFVFRISHCIKPLYFTFAFIFAASFITHAQNAVSGAPPLPATVATTDLYFNKNHKFYDHFAAQNAPNSDRGKIDPRHPSQLFQRQYFAAAALKDATVIDAAPLTAVLDESLNLDINYFSGTVRAAVLQPDGKILLAGYFRTVNGTRWQNLVRLNADRSVDPNFSVQINGSIQAIALQPDGKILLGGDFTVVNEVSRHRLARLNTDGTLDAAFVPDYLSLDTERPNTIYQILLQQDGRIVVTGNIISFANNGLKFGIARLNNNGSLDTGFASPLPVPRNPVFPPFPPSALFSSALQTDGKILVSGFIVKSTAEPNPDITSVARLNSDGSFDSSFNPPAFNSNATEMALQPDGKILLAGFFSEVGGRNYLVRLNSDGTPDASFNTGTGPSFPVFTLDLRSDGAVFISGIFSSYNGIARNGLAQVNADGSLNSGFVPQTNTFGSISTALPLAEGKLLMGGSFIVPGSAASRDTTIILNADGRLDSNFTFSSTALGGIRASLVQPDGTILIGGFFNRVSNVERRGIAKIKANNTLDAMFNPNFPSSAKISALARQPDGRILVGGRSLRFTNSTMQQIVRLNADGSFDDSFSQDEIFEIDEVRAIAVSPDGKIIVSYKLGRGSFNGGGLKRLNADGSVDASFNQSAGGAAFESLALQPDGKLLAGGAFSFGYIITGGPSTFFHGAMRFNTDGSHDLSFRPATFSEGFTFTRVYDIEVLPNGQVLLAGRIYTASATTAPSAVRRFNADGTLDASFLPNAVNGVSEEVWAEDVERQPDGKLLVGGGFNSISNAPRSNVARLNADGTLDSTFNASTDAPVYSIKGDVRGRIVLAGDFERVNNAPRTVLARITGSVAARRVKFDFDGDRRADIAVFRGGNWFIQNSATGFLGISFGAATDKLVPEDYDGDGRTDVAVFRDGHWYLLQSSNNAFVSLSFGQAGDIPATGDFDGDGKADIAVFRAGFWYRLNSSNNQFVAVSFGAAGDHPVQGDYDGDGKDDPAVYRGGNWFALQSSEGFKGVQFGSPSDVPVAGDFDGDARHDFTVYRDGFWYSLGSQNGFNATQFGVATDLPVAADYDGDGKYDRAVFRSGNWYLLQSNDGFAAAAFGLPTDQPVMTDSY